VQVFATICNCLKFCTMMKTISFFTLVATCALFVSCNKDNTSSTAGLLLGTWKLIKTNNITYFAGSGPFLNGNYTVSFGSDGTGEETQVENNTSFSDTYNFTWAAQGDSITVITTSATGTNGTKSSIDGTDVAVAITANTMTLRHNNHLSVIADTFMYVRQ